MALIQAFDLPFGMPALVAAVIACIGIALLLRRGRRKRLGVGATVLLCIALVLTALAAGGLRVAVPGENKVQVLVDESASMRGASYHDEAFLQRRIRNLLGRLPYRVSRFAEVDGTTRLPALAAGPVVLFSDGQFELPEIAGAVYPVVDVELGSPDDARVVEIRPERGEAIAVLENQGADRQATLDGNTIELPPGRHRIALGPAAQAHSVAITGRDRWPENDQINAPGEAPDHLELWNVGLPASPGFRSVAAGALPADAGEYVGCAMLALDAQAAGGLSPAQQAAVARYVRDLGGSVMLVGANAGWTYLRGTALERLSPLSVDPPLPQAQWTLLLDASGSMAQNESGVNKWQEALRAAQMMIRGVPERDRVRIGSFAQEVRWWATGPAGTTPVTPPAGLSPHGPTNLVPALAAAMEVGTEARRELLLLTDAEVEIPDVEGWARRMREANIHVNCLVLADGRGRGALEALSSGTGGRLLVEADPQHWAAASQQLAGEVAPGRWKEQPVQVQMRWPLPQGAAAVAAWNEAWAREGATPIALHGEQVLGAWWRAGAGQATAIAWWPGERAMAEMAQNTQAKATSDAYQVEWPSDDRDVVRVHAEDRPVLRFAPSGQEARAIPMTLTAPGQYETAIPFAWRGGYATVLVSGDVVARRVFAPAYPPEFAHLGTHRANLEQLADQTGGRVVEPSERDPLPIRLPLRWVDLSVVCGVAALALAGAAVVLLRRRVWGTPAIALPASPR